MFERLTEWRSVALSWLASRRRVTTADALRRCTVVLRELWTFAAVMDDVNVAQLLIVEVER